MKAVVTRVTSASIQVESKIVGEISAGLLILLGVAPNDTVEITEKFAEKICNLRIFSDENGKMNQSLSQIQGSILVVSQFTLFADTKSRRPGFTGAAKPDVAIALYERFIEKCRSLGFPVETGIFGADMSVYSVNDGPVTLIMDTEIVSL